MIVMLADELRLAIQQLHGCPSRIMASVPLSDNKLRRQSVDGRVHVFELIGHPSALRCYAWATPTKTSSTVMHAVLHAQGVTSPEAALQSVLRGKKKRLGAVSG